jgi:4-hydroxybenzoate polyprenyltransferase
LKTTLLPTQAGISRVNLFLALSRTPHLLLDLAAPGLAALLCLGTLGTIPSVKFLVLGFITAFSGYTAVYALNDIVDYRVDREIIHPDAVSGSKPDLDNVFIRHPLAQGLLSYRDALIWMVSWASLAMAGAFLLNPVCPFIFLLASLLEIIYCYLLKITYLRSMISGIVKTSGPVAAVFAVTPDPSPLFLVMLFLWLFFWEIGGQNIPNDLSDMDTDQKIRARTIPVQFGVHRAIGIILLSLWIAMVLSLAIYWTLPGQPGLLYLPGAFLSGLYFLLLPGYRLYRFKTAGDALHLFNRASWYPLSMLTVIALHWLV